MKIKDIIKRIQLYPDDMEISDDVFTDAQTMMLNYKHGYDDMNKIPSEQRKWYITAFYEGEYKGIKCKCCECMIGPSNPKKDHRADCPVRGEHE